MYRYDLLSTQEVGGGGGLHEGTKERGENRKPLVYVGGGNLGGTRIGRGQQGTKIRKMKTWRVFEFSEGEMRTATWQAHCLEMTDPEKAETRRGGVKD